MKSASLLLFFILSSQSIFGQVISDVTFQIGKKDEPSTIKIEEGDEYSLSLSTSMVVLYYTKKGHKEKKYTTQKNLIGMSYQLDGEEHEFKLIEGHSPRYNGRVEYYSVLLEKVFESDNVSLYFSPTYNFRQGSISDIRRDHYLIDGKGIMSQHDGTLSSLSRRLSLVSCKCKSMRRSDACAEVIKNEFESENPVLSKEKMIEIIRFWEDNCTME